MVKVGDKVPSATLKTMGDSGMQDITTEELTTGKKVRYPNEHGGNSKLHSVCGADRSSSPGDDQNHSDHRDQRLFVRCRLWSLLCQERSRLPAGTAPRVLVAGALGTHWRSVTLRLLDHTYKHACILLV